MTAPVCAPLGPGFEPRSPAWLGTVSASKIPVLMGEERWHTPYSLWMEMAGRAEPESQNADQSRGHFFEAKVLELFRRQGHDVIESGGYRRLDEPRFTATPDSIVRDAEGSWVAVVEAKCDRDCGFWTDPPRMYRLQCQWQMFVTGRELAYLVAVDAQRLWEMDPLVLVIERDEELIEEMRASARGFLDSLDLGFPPPMDYQSKFDQRAVRYAHPVVEGRSFEVPARLGQRWRELSVEHAKRSAAVKDVTKARSEVGAEILDAMGDAKDATFEGERVATRGMGKNRAPYLRAVGMRGDEDGDA